MSCASQSVLSTSSCSFSTNGFNRNVGKRRPITRIFFSADASSPKTEDSDCNDEECAPDKEVGKVSMEWLAGEKTKVVGTFPPRNRGWTGYVEKDTAGQTNIYSVEPSVYVADSGISSGTAGSSSDGSENTIAVSAGVGLLSAAVAGLILLLVGKNAPQMQTADYAGPPLSYYITKFEAVGVRPSESVSIPDASPESSSQAEAPQV